MALPRGTARGGSDYTHIAHDVSDTGAWRWRHRPGSAGTIDPCDQLWTSLAGARGLHRRCPGITLVDNTRAEHHAGSDAPGKPLWSPAPASCPGKRCRASYSRRKCRGGACPRPARSYLEAGNAPALHASPKPAAPRSASLPYWYRGVGLALAGIILLTMAFSGDEAQLAQPHASSVVLNWLYLVAQSLLFGGFAYLGYILIPLLLAGKPERRAEILALLLQRLVTPALVTFGVLLVSGLFLSESSLTGVQQLFSNPYGRTMLIKL